MSFILYLSLVGGRDQKLVSNSVKEEISSHTLALYALFSVKIYHDHHREKLADGMVPIKASCGQPGAPWLTSNILSQKSPRMILIFVVVFCVGSPNKSANYMPRAVLLEFLNKDDFSRKNVVKVKRFASHVRNTYSW